MTYTELQRKLLDAIASQNRIGEISDAEYLRLRKAILCGICESFQPGYRLSDIK